MTYKRPDAWSRKARKEGFAARSVYKLEEIQRRQPVLKRGQRVLDLGCAPGSWSVWSRKLIGPGGTLVGIDIQELGAYPGTFLHASITETEPEVFLEQLGGPADVVLSDMAPNTTGDRFGDHVRQVELAALARDTALALLAPGGAFVVKVFEGEDAQPFVQSLRPHFERVRRLKPAATRGRSVEFFVVATGRKPA